MNSSLRDSTYGRHVVEPLLDRELGRPDHVGVEDVALGGLRLLALDELVALLVRGLRELGHLHGDAGVGGVERLHAGRLGAGRVLAGAERDVPLGALHRRGVDDLGALDRGAGVRRRRSASSRPSPSRRRSATTSSRGNRSSATSARLRCMWASSQDVVARLPGASARERPLQASSARRRRRAPSWRSSHAADGAGAGAPARGGPARGRRRAAACAARAAGRGSRTPSPAQSARAAFSGMSPPAGQTTTGQPQASARTSVPWPPWVTTRSQAGIVRA